MTLRMTTAEFIEKAIYVNGVKTIPLAGKMHNLDKIVLPVPGCNNGGLSYENEVRPLISSILDDRFVVCRRNEND